MAASVDLNDSSTNNGDVIFRNPGAVELLNIELKESNGDNPKETPTAAEGGDGPKDATKKKRTSRRSARRRQGNVLKSLLAVTEASIQEDQSDEEIGDIWQASRLGHVSAIQHILIESPELMDRLDVNGAAPMHYAVRFNHENVVEELLLQGADPNIALREYRITPLHIAAKCNYTTIMKMLIKRGASPKATDLNGMVPLHFSTRRGNREATEVLLVAKGSDVNVKDSDKMTPLHHSAMSGDVTISRVLLERGADVQAKEINDITPLMFAAIRGNTDMMRFLVDAGKKKNIRPIDFMVDIDDEGSNSLHLSVARGHIEVVEYCLELGADVESGKHNGFTPLHIAAVSGNAEMAKLLVDKGAKVTSRDDEQMTPLHRASLYSRMDVMRFLIQKGASLESKDLEYFTPLLAAAWKGQTEAAQFLLQQSADITVSDRDMKTALHWAVEGNHSEFVKILLENGGTDLLNETDKRERTAVHFAAESGNAKILSILIEYKADVVCKDHEERLPLHIAACNGHLECVRLLAKAAPTRINDDDIDGRTPLLLASEEGHYKVVKRLLKVGADISSKDENRRSALAIAAKEGHLDTIKVLLKNHAEIDSLDKNKNTPLHLSAGNGNVDVTKLLLDSGACVTTQNEKQFTCLDEATHMLEEDTAAAIVKHRTWREVISQPGAGGDPPLKGLIEKLPDVAYMVLDQCVQFSHSDKTNPNLKITYEYEYIDPGPVESKKKGPDGRRKKRWCALAAMVQFGREHLLMHELCKTLLMIKWKKFGVIIFSIDVSMYIMFLLSLMVYIGLTPRPEKHTLDTHGCPLPYGVNVSVYFDEDGNYIGEYETDYMVIFEISIFLYCFINVMRELVEIFKTGMKYFSEIANGIDWCLYVSASVFVFPPAQKPCAVQWTAGAVAAFFSWMNLIMYVRRVDLFGIYIVMFYEVVKSFLKAVVVFFLFVMAFATSFSILLGRIEQFSTLWNSFVKVCVMTVGEMDYSDIFYSDVSVDPFEDAATVLFMAFLFLMPIVLMNLMVGIAVGDIEYIKQNANIEKIEMQVDLVRGIELNLPIWLQKRLYVRRMVVEPYKRKAFKRLRNRFSRRDEGAEIAAKEEARMAKEENVFEQLRKDVDEFKSKMTNANTNLTLMVEKQTELMRKLAEKMEVAYDETEFITAEK